MANCANIMLPTMPFSLFWCIVVASLCCSSSWLSAMQCLFLYSLSIFLRVAATSILSASRPLFVYSLIVFLRVADLSILSALRHLFLYSLLVFLHFAIVSMPPAWCIVFILSKILSCWAFCHVKLLLSLFSAAGLAGNLVILRFATSSCWAFLFCYHVKLLPLLFLSCGTCNKPNNWTKQHGVKNFQQWDRIC